MEGHFPSNRRDSRNYQLERTTEQLVMPSEIQGLSNLRAYLKSGNLVVPLSFPYIDLPKRYEALIERKLPARQLTEERAQTATALGNSDGCDQSRNLPPPIPPQRQPQLKPPTERAANGELPFLE